MPRHATGDTAAVFMAARRVTPTWRCEKRRGQVPLSHRRSDWTLFLLAGDHRAEQLVQVVFGVLLDAHRAARLLFHVLLLLLRHIWLRCVLRESNTSIDAAVGRLTSLNELQLKVVRSTRIDALSTPITKCYCNSDSCSTQVEQLQQHRRRSLIATVKQVDIESESSLAAHLSLGFLLALARLDKVGRSVCEQQAATARCGSLGSVGSGRDRLLHSTADVRVGRATGCANTHKLTN